MLPPELAKSRAGTGGSQCLDGKSGIYWQSLSWLRFLRQVSRLRFCPACDLP